jgi:type III secretion system YscD/HrpQ family protein
MSPLLELRILSGPSLGAAIELAEGTYTLGADDACDLILAADTSVAGRHLELQVRAREGLAPEVWARPLEGGIVIDGAATPEEGAPLANGAALALGFTALAWQPAGSAWGTITLAPLEFARFAPAGEKAEPPETQARETEARESREKTAPPETTAARESPPSETPTPETRPPSLALPRTRAGLAGLTVGLAVFAALVFLVAALATGKEIPGFPPSPGAAAQRLRLALDAAGFRNIRVETDAARALVLRGQVENDQALRRVFHLTEGLPFRVRVSELRVGSDLLRVTRETLNTHGFFPEVRYRDASGDDLALALYLKDSMVETGMMASLSQDLPKLAAATRKVAYARDVAPVLERELSQIGLEGERAVYLAGKVALPFRLDFRSREQLDAALAAVRKTLGVPVLFQVTETALDRLPDARTIRLSQENSPDAEGGRSASADGEPDRLGGLRVMSVTLGEIPFVTMSDQQKFFPGAELPGGATIVSIHPDRLILQDGAETITYPLKEEP